jgi:hypothetical protein
LILRLSCLPYRICATIGLTVDENNLFLKLTAADMEIGRFRESVIMKFAPITVVLVLMVFPSFADPVLHTSESDFLRVLDRPYLLEDFSTYSYGSYKGQELLLEQNGYQAVLSVQRGLYALNGSMSTRWDVDVLKIDFSGSPNPVTAVGGFFWPTDLPGNNLVGPMRFVLSNGNEYLLRDAYSGSFVGFTVFDGTSFQSLEISTLLGGTWPTVDHLYVGNDPPIPTPEVSSWLFFVAGICGVGVIIGVTILRKKKIRPIF